MTKKFLKGIRKAIGTKYKLGIKKTMSFSIHVSSRHLGISISNMKKYIYECGKKITFEDMSPGITFIFFYKNKTLEKNT